MPIKWHELYNLLPNTKPNGCGGYTPAVPLILGAWHDATAPP
jgi:hypothetical protein